MRECTWDALSETLYEQSVDDGDCCGGAPEWHTYEVDGSDYKSEYKQMLERYQKLDDAYRTALRTIKEMSKLLDEE